MRRRPVGSAFFRTVVNDRGVPCDCTLERIEIRRARTEQRALAAAMRRFERRYRLRAWDHVAHGYVSEKVRPGEDPSQARRRVGRTPRSYFTVTQVQFARLPTLCDTLPTSIPLRSPRPREPMMIMLTFSSSAPARMH